VTGSVEIRDIILALAERSGKVSGPDIALEHDWDWPACKRIIAANKSLIHMTKTEPPLITLTPAGKTAAAK